MPAAEKTVMIVGDAGVDIIVPFPRFLNEERTLVDFTTPVLQGGGTAANTAVALAKLGVPVHFLGTIGDDQYGKYVLSDFRREKVYTHKMIIDQALNTVGVFAFIDEFGERYLWGWPREKQAFKQLDQSKVDFNGIKDAAWVHSSGMAMVDDTSSRHTIIQILKTAHQAGIPTSFDLNLRVDDGMLDESYRQAVLEIMEYCTYVLGSGAEEFYYLHPCENWLDSTRYFVRENRTIIARMGKDGSMALTTDGEIHKPAYPVSVVDTVGAGDVYNAGFIAGILAGKTLDEALVMGNGVSGYKVNRIGPRSTPKLEQLMEFIKER